MCAFVWLAEKVTLSLAVLFGTVGGRIAGTSNPASKSFLLTRRASSEDPKIMGWIGVFESNMFIPTCLHWSLKCSINSCKRSAPSFFFDEL